MNCFWKYLLIATFGGLNLCVINARADLEVSTSVRVHATADFYAPLAPHGTWVEVGTYGRCWHPVGVAVGWAPYCSGSWVWTDCGWYWSSDEPWGWACYHYGTWVVDPAFGWVWVPGIEWAPAWVSWRVGGGYCGWAPLPPHGVVIAPGSFVFVESAHFYDPIRPSTLIVRNETIINKTTVVGGTSHENRTIGSSAPQRVVVNQGPGLETIQKSTGKTVTAVPIQVAASRAPVPPELSRTAGASDRNQRKDDSPARPTASPDRDKDPGNVNSSPSPERGGHPEKSGRPGKGNGHGKD